MGSPTYFFVHVMKTAGTTFTQHIQANFADDEVFPAPSAPKDLDRMYGYYLVRYLRALSDEDRRRIRIYGGHFPHAAAGLVGADTVLTILRDPVARTISYLRHCRKEHRKFRESPLEEIYDDPWQFPTKIHNYQVKLFAMDERDKLESHLDVIDVDDERLAKAKEVIEGVDLLGLQEHYDEFVADVGRRLGWTIGPVGNMRVTEGPDEDVSPALRQRIIEENAADVAFYEHARAVWESRRVPSVPTPGPRTTA